MLEQITKFKKYDAEEVTESGKERLRSEWGDTVRQLLTVWSNFEELVNADAQRKKNKSSRLRKETNSKKDDDVSLAKTIREAALQTIQINTNNESFKNLDFEYDDGRSILNSNASDINDATVNDIPNNGATEQCCQQSTNFQIKKN
jgi:hypothetical protein